jgi:hypothetical protein
MGRFAPAAAVGRLQVVPPSVTRGRATVRRWKWRHYTKLCAARYGSVPGRAELRPRQPRDRVAERSGARCQPDLGELGGGVDRRAEDLGARWGHGDPIRAGLRRSARWLRGLMDRLGPGLACPGASGRGPGLGRRGPFRGLGGCRRRGPFRGSGGFRRLSRFPRLGPLRCILRRRRRPRRGALGGTSVRTCAGQGAEDVAWSVVAHRGT